MPRTGRAAGSESAESWRVTPTRSPCCWGWTWTNSAWLRRRSPRSRRSSGGGRQPARSAWLGRPWRQTPRRRCEPSSAPRHPHRQPKGAASGMPSNLWNDAAAARQPALDGLVYRSTLLARDRSVVNIFGGNTSAKLTDTDHLGRSVELLWVKGSGTDMAAIPETGFAALRLAEILPLTARDAMTDEEMVEYLTRCAAFPNRPRQSIETLLHAFLPARHVDHTHPDAVISLACASDGQALCRRLWGNRAVWVDYTRPGVSLSQ